MSRLRQLSLTFQDLLFENHPRSDTISRLLQALFPSLDTLFQGVFAPLRVGHRHARVNLEHLGYRLSSHCCCDECILFADLDVNVLVWDRSCSSVRAECALIDGQEFSLVEVRCQGLVSDDRE